MTEPRGRRFDAVAAEYDRVRPGYPDALVDEACARAALRPGSRVVEVGCGTGKLTVALVERGLQVEAVDPGAAMIEVARSRLASAPVRFHVAPFEEVDLPERAFEAIFSAEAFHWIDPAVGWAKAAGLLRPKGALALLSHIAADTELSVEYRAAWRAVMPEEPEWVLRDPKTLRAGAEERRDNVSAVWSWLTNHELTRPDAAALFADVRISMVRIDEEETAEGSLALTRTTSLYLGLDPGRRRRLEQLLTAAFERAGGSYISTHFATLVTARARGV